MYLHYHHVLTLSTYITIGNKNEIPLVKSLLSMDFNATQTWAERLDMEIIALAQLGLVRNKQRNSMTASVDIFGSYRCLSTRMIKNIVIELKSRLAGTAMGIETLLASTVGEVTVIHLKSSEVSLQAALELLAKAIPERPHRFQLVHHMGVTNTEDGLIMYGREGGRIIRMVHVTMDHNLRMAYLSQMEEVIYSLVPWLSNMEDDMDAQTMTQHDTLFLERLIANDELKTVHNMDHLYYAIHVVKELRKNPVQSAYAFNLKPAHIIMYNATMGGEDAISKSLRGIQPQFLRECTGASGRLMCEYILMVSVQYIYICMYMCVLYLYIVYIVHRYSMQLVIFRCHRVCLVMF